MDPQDEFVVPPRVVFTDKWGYLFGNSVSVHFQALQTKSPQWSRLSRERWPLNSEVANHKLSNFYRPSIPFIYIIQWLAHVNLGFSNEEGKIPIHRYH